MEIRTFQDLIDWTRALHGHLADCMSRGAVQQKQEHARYLLEYLSRHEKELERIVQGFEDQANKDLLNTRLYDFETHEPTQPVRAMCEPYGSFTFEEICRQVFEFRNQVIDLYRGLHRKAEVPEIEELIGWLLEVEENEAMRMARQAGSTEDL